MRERSRFNSFTRAAWIVAAGGFLLLLCAVPLFGLLHAASGALLGAMILLGLAALQYPLFLLVRRWLPTVDRGADETSMIA